MPTEREEWQYLAITRGEALEREKALRARLVEAMFECELTANATALLRELGEIE